MTAQVVPFTFQAQHPIRVTIIDNDPWFCLRDACVVLDIRNPSPERFQLDSRGVTRNVIPTTSGDQEIVFINEPNLYRVIFRSNKPEARAFQDWVFAEVLPAIRKTGVYQAAAPKPGIPDAQWRDVQIAIDRITRCVWFEKGANDALHERIRWIGGVPSSRLLPPEQLGAVLQELEALHKLACAYLDQRATLDKNFIATVLRPPVSIRKVRALTRQQALQPTLLP